MRFNITWDSSVDAAPAAFKTDILAVAQYFANAFTDPVTVNIAIGFGEVAGYQLASGALGESLTYLTSTGFKQVISALRRDALTANDASAVKSLPSADPTGGGHYFLTTANAKALGLYSSLGYDGYVGFSSTAPFTYDASHGVAAGTYDFFAVAAHEFSEIMGRQLLAGETLGSTSNTYTALDLFHWAAAGVRALTGAAAGYFSFDGGATHLQSFNTNPGGDFGDWASSAGADAFNAFANSGVVNKITAGDLTALDVIGWNLGASGSSASSAYPAGTNVHLSAANQVTAHEAGLADALLNVGRALHDPSLVADLSAFYGYGA